MPAQMTDNDNNYDPSKLHVLRGRGWQNKLEKDSQTK